MLKRFTVENFKNFKDKIVFDLSKPGNYGFGKENIKNGLVNKGAVFGINGIGKSNLGLAIFDIVNNLTNKVKELARYSQFLNMDSKKSYATFEYEFLFGNHTLIYKYSKKDVKTLIEESLVIDDKEMIFYDFREKAGFSKFKGSETLNMDDNSPNSRVKYIMNSAILVEDDELNGVFIMFKSFVEKMLLFYSLRENGFIGFKDNTDNVDSIIINADKVSDFENFLKKFGINVNLIVVESPERKSLYIKYENGVGYYFSVASTGMVSLILFYSWLITLQQCSFVYIDEFDAFYHFELSKGIVEELKKFSDVQIFVSTHTTDLISNDLFRPDCYFVLTEYKIDSLNHMTEKDIRHAQNLQKMFKEGAFNEQ